MNVLFITHYVEMAGANRSMLQLILELKENFDVVPYVLLPEFNEQRRTLKDYLKDSGVKYLECEFTGWFKAIDNFGYHRRLYVQYLDSPNAISSSLKSFGIDIVHSNSSVIDFGGVIARMLGAKHVWHLREFGELDYNLTSIFGSSYEKATYKNCDAFIAISKVIKDSFCNNNIDESKIHVIYNGIFPKTNILLAQHKNSSIQFLCAGVYCEGKNQKEILRAANELVNIRGIYNFHITFVGFGNESEYAIDLQKYTLKHGLSNYVSILPPTDGIESLASTMDVGIVPSHNEAFGRVTVEYMLQNLAVIANTNGANPEIIKDCESGLLYPADDFIALADRMELLIKDRLKLENLAHRGFMHANEFFLSRYNTNQVYQLYLDLLHKKKGTTHPLLANIIRATILCFYRTKYSIESIRKRIMIRTRFMNFWNRKKKDT